MPTQRRDCGNRVMDRVPSEPQSLSLIFPGYTLLIIDVCRIFFLDVLTLLIDIHKCHLMMSSETKGFFLMAIKYLFTT